MNVQSIELSPIDVLKRFCEMEKHFPHRGDFKLYNTSLRFYINNDDDLAQTCQQEAENMMNFVGLIGYTPVIKFENLDDANGNINLNPAMTVVITLGESIRHDTNAIMATLAHEICHKLLYTSGLFYSGQLGNVENELLADLATFYVGFGCHTMNGFYRSSYNRESRSGYLTPRTYGCAFLISCKVHNLNPYEMLLENHAKSALRDASQMISNDFFFNKLDEKAINDCFLKTGQKTSRILHRLDYLMELLRENRSSIVDDYRQLNDLFYNNPQLHVKAPQATPYMALAVRHLQLGSVNLRKASSINERLDRNINGFIPVVNKVLMDKGCKESSMKKMASCCPFCGSFSKTDLREEKAYHFICPSCKKHFITDLSFRMATPKTKNVDSDVVSDRDAARHVEYVYIGANYGVAKDIPLKKRWGLFFKAQREIWKSLFSSKH